jgi:WD40 repeat protein/serine/threonine protein kinase
MGIVYEAEQVSLGRRMALKVLPILDAMDPRHLLRFHNESRAAASLKHPNIVSVHSIGSEQGLHYYAMDYIDGRTLAEVIAQLQRARGTASRAVRGPEETPPDPAAVDATTVCTQAAALPCGSTLPAHDTQAFFRTVASWGMQAAEGLDHAHTVGIVHRDIKPSNLMVDASGHLWITDFGLAMGDTIAGPTMSGDLLGTLRYMSPEQASGARQVLDARTDIYSLGVTLYELVSLQPAFLAEDRHELLHHIVDTEPSPPHHLNTSIPRDLETIILKAMGKEPAARYTSARALADDLRRFLADQPIAAQRPTVRERSGRWLRRHRAIVGAASILLIVTTVLSVTGMLFVTRAHREAIRQRNAAERQREVARRHEASLRAHLNVANIHWAWTAWHSGKLEQATGYLSQQIPGPGEEDTRSFAWYYLWRVCHCPRLVLEGHAGVVYGLAFSPDGKTLISSGVDHKVIVWDLSTGQQRACWEDFQDDVNCVRFSSDGRLLATGEEDRRVRIWDVASGRVVQSLSGFSLPVAAVFFAPDDTHLLVSEIRWPDRTGYTSVWDLRSGQQETRFEASMFALSPDGCAALLHRGLWNWTDERERLAPTGLGAALVDSPCAGVVLSDGATVALGGLRHLISVQRLPGRESVTTLHGHTGAIRSLDFSAGANLLASGADDGVVRLWDTLTWDLHGVLPRESGRIWTVAFSPDGNRLATGGDDGKIRLWSPADCRAAVRLLASLPRVCSLTFASSDQLLIAGSPHKSSWGLWDTTTGRLVESFDSPGEKDGHLAASPAEPLVALGLTDGTVQLVDRVSGATRQSFPAERVERNPWSLRELAFSPDGRYLAAARARGATEDDSRIFMICVWEVASGGEILSQHYPAPHGGSHAQSFAFSPDSRTLAVPCDGDVHLHDLVSHTMRVIIGDAAGKVWSVAYSADGKWLALGGEARSLCLVDRLNPAVGKQLVGPQGLANVLAFSPDGRTLACGSSTGQVTLWDVRTGEELCELHGPAGSVHCAAFSADGTQLAVGSELTEGGSTVHVWHAPRTEDGRGS